MRQFLNMAAYDIRFSFRKNRSKWLVGLLIQLYVCIRIFHALSFYMDLFDLLSELWMVMCGEREMILTIEGSYWILFHGYLFFLIGFYPVNELYLGNGQTCIRSHSRKRWLLSKFVSVAVNVMAYYGCCVMLLFLGNLFYGGTLLPENGVIGIGVPIYNQSITELSMYYLVLPFLVSLALGELQVLLSFWITPVFAFMSVIGYMIAAVFWVHPCCLGNFSMLYRQEWISGNPAINIKTGVLLCILLLAAAVVIGMILFEKKDILPEE